MHIRELKPKDWEPYGTFPQGVLHALAVQRGITDSPYLPLIRLGDVVVMHSRGRWGTALVTMIGRKILTASYVTRGGIDSRPRFPNVTNKSVPIKECFGADGALLWSDWHVPSDDDLPLAVNERVGETHKPSVGSPGPTRLAAMFTLG